MLIGMLIATLELSQTITSDKTLRFRLQEPAVYLCTQQRRGKNHPTFGMFGKIIPSHRIHVWFFPTFWHQIDGHLMQVEVKIPVPWILWTKIHPEDFPEQSSNSMRTVSTSCGAKINGVWKAWFWEAWIPTNLPYPRLTWMRMIISFWYDCVYEIYGGTKKLSWQCA